MTPVSRGLTKSVVWKVPSAREPEAVYRIFGRRLRELREQKRVSQDELAAFSGLTRSSIANIESGKQRVFLHQILLFVDRLNVGLDQFVRPEDFAREAVQETSKADMTDFLERAKSYTTTAGKEPGHEEEDDKSGKKG